MHRFRSRNLPRMSPNQLWGSRFRFQRSLAIMGKFYSSLKTSSSKLSPPLHDLTFSKRWPEHKIHKMKDSLIRLTPFNHWTSFTICCRSMIFVWKLAANRTDFVLTPMKYWPFKTQTHSQVRYVDPKQLVAGLVSQPRIQFCHPCQSRLQSTWDGLHN